jgi:hypothetical protein
VFSVSALDSAISLGNFGSFPWRVTFKTKIWALDSFIASGMVLSLGICVCVCIHVCPHTYTSINHFQIYMYICYRPMSSYQRLHHQSSTPGFFLLLFL